LIINTQHHYKGVGGFFNERSEKIITKMCNYGRIYIINPPHNPHKGGYLDNELGIHIYQYDEYLFNIISVIKKYFMENNKKQKIETLNVQIKELNKEKETLQKTCNHKNLIVKFENGTSVMKTYCEDCSKETGYPSQSQIEDFLK
jgi:hypothetical protein